MNFHYSQLEATFGTEFIKIRDKHFCGSSWRLLHRLFVIVDDRKKPKQHYSQSQAGRFDIRNRGMSFSDSCFQFHDHH